MHPTSTTTHIQAVIWLGHIHFQRLSQMVAETLNALMLLSLLIAMWKIILKSQLSNNLSHFKFGAKPKCSRFFFFHVIILMWETKSTLCTWILKIEFDYNFHRSRLAFWEFPFSSQRMKGGIKLFPGCALRRHSW